MAGAALRTVALLLRVLQFICSLICMAIFSYFIVVLRNFDLHVLIKWRLVEAFTVLATVYTLLAILLVLCLAGSKIFGFIAIFFDIFFIGCFIAVAWLTRHGAYQCNGLVRTPVGDGLSQYGAFGITNTSNYRPRLGTACRLNRTVFALAIILIFLFLVTAILQLLMSRSKKDKRYASNEKDYNNTGRSSKTPLWKRNRNTRTRTRSRSTSRTRSHRDKDLAVAGTGATATRGLSGRRSGDSGSTLDDGNYARTPKHHESGFDRPGHTPITGTGHGRHTPRADGTYQRDDGTYGNRNNPNDPVHSVTVHSPTTTTTTTTHLPANPVVARSSSRGRRGAPVYATEDSHGHTHVPGFNQPLTQHTPYHEITTKEQRDAALRNQNAGLGQPGYGQNIVSNNRDYDNTRRSGDYNRRDITPGRDTTLGRDRDITPGRVRDITPGRTSNRNTITNSRDYDNTRGSGDYGRRDITPGRDTEYSRNTIANQRDYDDRNQAGYNPNLNQGYDDNYNRDSSFNRTPSAGRVRRF